MIHSTVRTTKHFLFVLLFSQPNLFSGESICEWSFPFVVWTDHAFFRSSLSRACPDFARDLRFSAHLVRSHLARTRRSRPDPHDHDHFLARDPFRTWSIWTIRRACSSFVHFRPFEEDAFPASHDFGSFQHYLFLFFSPSPFVWLSNVGTNSGALSRRK